MSERKRKPTKAQRAVLEYLAGGWELSRTEGLLPTFNVNNLSIRAATFFAMREQGWI